MQLANVVTPHDIYEERNVALTKNTLASLYEVMHEKKFGLINVSYEARKKAMIAYIRMVRKLGGKIYIDSGGYSVIAGKVPFYHIEDLVEYYLCFLENEVVNYDYIFSLDIPWGFSEDWLQDKAIVRPINYMVIDKTIKVIKRNPAIRDKIIFINHFKMLDQHRIWRKLRKELEIDKHIIHKAIGGLVSLKGTARIREFTAFTPMIFRLFQDYLESGIVVEELRFHILGVYLIYERFVIALAEAILNLYTRERGIKTRVVFTYDSTNPAQQAWKNSKTMQFYSYRNHNLSRFRYHKIPPEILQTVYGPAMNHAQAEINNLQNGNRNLGGKKRMDNSKAFVPMSVYSQLEIDKFLMWMIGLHNILDILAEKEPKSKITALRDSLQKQLYGKDIFPDHIEFELNVLSKLFRWLFGSRDEEVLDDIVEFFIHSINYPHYLK